MKNLLKIILISSFIIPNLAFGAIAVGWNATSTDIGFIAPNAVNGNAPYLSFTFASTTATSTMKGINLPYGGCFAIGGTCLNTGGSAFSGAPNSILVSNATGNAVVATSSNPLWVGSLIATTTLNSGFGTTTPFGMLSVHSQGGKPDFVTGSSTKTNFIIDKNGNVGIQTATPGVLLDLPNFSTSNSQFRIGTLEQQGFSLNNAWIGENVFYNGSNFQYRNTGAAGLFYFLGNEGQFRFAPSGTAGNNANLSVNAAQFKVNSDGSVALGGSINTGAGVYTGASLLVGPNGVLTIATTTAGCLNTSSGGIVYSASCSSGSSVGPVNVLQASNGSGGFIATGTPQLTVGNIIATSTATSYFMGSVGIGTTSPGSLLSIGANATGINFYDNGTSTFSGKGINLLNGGCFAIAGTCISGSGSGLSSYDAWTHPFAASSATTSTIYMNTGGLDVTASTTLGSTINFPALTQGSLYVGSAGLVKTVATSTPSVAGVITYSGTLGSFLGGASGSLGILNQGTTVQVLHGNAAGQATFGSIVNGDITNGTIDLTTKVTGILPIANGGSNASSFTPNTLIFYDGTRLISTTSQLTVNNIIASSTSAVSEIWGNTGFATSTPWGQVAINPIGGQASNQFVIGSSTRTNFLVNNAGNVGVGSLNPLTNLQVGSGTQAFIGSNIYAGVNTPGAAGFALHNSNLNTEVGLFAGNSGDGSIGSISNNPFKFQSNNTEIARITPAGFLAIGTTTPSIGVLTVSSSTLSQIALSAGAGIAQWTFRNAGGNFYLSTSTIVGTSTSTLPALSIIGSTGAIGVGTSTPGKDGLLGVSQLEIANPTFAGVGFISASTSAANRTVAEILTQNSAGSVQGLVLGTLTNDATSIISNALTRFTVAAGGNVGVGTTTPFGTFSINAASQTNPYFAIGSSSSPVVSITPNGTTRVGVATSSPWRTLSIVGTVAINGLSSVTGKNYVCIDSVTKEIVDAGSTSSCLLSSIYSKDITGEITPEIASYIVEHLNGITFNYKGETEEHYGFIAEKVAQVDRDVTSKFGVSAHLAEYATKDETITMDDGSTHLFKKGDPVNVQYPNLTAVLVVYLQNIQAKTAQKSPANNLLYGFMCVALIYVAYNEITKRKQ